MAQVDEQQLRLKINQKLIETGEKESLKEVLKAKLVECGWKDGVKNHCKELINRKSPNSDITVEELVSEVTPFARSSVPEHIKKELQARIEKFINENNFE